MFLVLLWIARFLYALVINTTLLSLVVSHCYFKSDDSNTMMCICFQKHFVWAARAPTGKCAADPMKSSLKITHSNLLSWLIMSTGKSLWWKHVQKGSHLKSKVMHCNYLRSVSQTSTKSVRGRADKKRIILERSCPTGTLTCQEIQIHLSRECRLVCELITVSLCLTSAINKVFSPFWFN